MSAQHKPLHRKFRKLYFTLFLLVNAFFLLTFSSCGKENTEPDDNSGSTTEKTFVSAVDISRYVEIMEYNPTFYDLNGNAKELPDILKENGVNTIRLKLWVDPADGHNSLEEVNTFSKTLKNKGFKIWLTVHYSDTWADPGSQITPSRWANLDFETLKDSVSAYTAKVISQVKPDYIQIGNEINNGFLHPIGNINNFSQFKDLLNAGIQAVRNTNSSTKIMLHYAGYNGASLFFNKLKDLDYDIIGLSYYPWWHGDDLSALQTAMTQLSTSYDRDIIIAETAYPFTLNWNDWDTNIVGLENQLYPGYPASEAGQQSFIADIKQLSYENVERGLGFCYWGGEQIAWKGPEGTNASAWENLALFDFNNKALPVLTEFSNE